jgi:hypothetical protein
VWMKRDHFGGCVQMERSPFFPEIILSIGVYSFNVWQEGKPHCLFSSPFSSAHLTCGAWSPTRPGVILIGRQDGFLDIWDLADQSHKPAASSQIASCSVEALRFRPAQGVVAKSTDNSNNNNGSAGAQPSTSSNAGATTGPNSNVVDNDGANGGATDSTASDKTQLLGASDEQGNLHILEIPRNLRRRIANEKKLVRNFLLREIERLDYMVTRRNKLANSAVAAATAADDNSAVGGGGPGTVGSGGGSPEDSNPAVLGEHSAGGGVHEVKGGGGGGGGHGNGDDHPVEDETRAEQDLIDDEARYRALEQAFCKQLGIKTKGETTTSGAGGVAGTGKLQSNSTDNNHNGSNTPESA